MKFDNEIEIRERGLRFLKAVFRFVKPEKREEVRQMIETEEKVINELRKRSAKG